MKPVLSVILCTHNPPRKLLEQALTALAKQTLPQETWELLLIDNASRPALADSVKMDWHAHTRIVEEKVLGLTPARLRGISEAVGDLFVFVDDDNILNPDYLVRAAQIAIDWPILGAWGGQIEPRFEETPSEWTRPYWPMLAIRQFERDIWTNVPGSFAALPCGAGMCVRKIVAKRYSELAQADPVRLALDRKGAALTSGGDSDLALTARDMGLGTGLFTSLQMKHIIPPGRLEETYLLRLVEGIHHSNLWLTALHGTRPNPPKRSILSACANWVRLMRMPPRNRRFQMAANRGASRAIREIVAAQIESIP